MTTKKRKSWQEKFDNGRKPEVEVLESKFSDIAAGEKMLIATPRIIDDYIRQIPEGKSVNMKTMRRDIAADYAADNACPLTTGIFVRIISELAHEQYEQGKPISEITPFWRVLNSKTPLVKKLSFPYDFIAAQRKEEGLEN
jgi:hypothetical protein